MEKYIVLQWKQFSVPVDRLNLVLKNLVGSNYDGLICNPEDFYVVFKEVPEQEAANVVINFWNNAVEQQFSPSLREIISGIINNASVFGNALILDFAVENVQMGITQAGKTKLVADYCANVQRYLQSGSLYAAITEIDSLVNAGIPENLAPFITTQRLNSYKSKIAQYLGIG